VVNSENWIDDKFRKRGSYVPWSDPALRGTRIRAIYEDEKFDVELLVPFENRKNDCCFVYSVDGFLADRVFSREDRQLLNHLLLGRVNSPIQVADVQHKLALSGNIGFPARDHAEERDRKKNEVLEFIKCMVLMTTTKMVSTDFLPTHGMCIGYEVAKSLGHNERRHIIRNQLDEIMRRYSMSDAVIIDRVERISATLISVGYPVQMFVGELRELFSRLLRLKSDLNQAKIRITACSEFILTSLEWTLSLSEQIFKKIDDIIKFSIDKFIDPITPIDIEKLIDKLYWALDGWAMFADEFEHLVSQN